MSQLIIDLITLAIIAICVLYGWRKGFFRSLVNMCGSIMLFVASHLLSKWGAPVLYERFIGPYFEERINLYISNVGANVRMESVIINALTKIPSFSKTMLLAGTTQEAFIEEVSAAANHQVQNVAHLLVYDCMPAVIIPLVQACLFVLCIIILYFLLRGLILLIGNHASSKTLIGKVDVITGAVCGLGVGIILVLIFGYMIALFIGFTADGVSWCNSEIVSKTWLFRFLFALVEKGLSVSL